MSYKLFLDDEREPIGDDWFVARSCEQAKTFVTAWGVPSFISFDHDLGNGPTGKDFASWLVEYLLDLGGNFDPNRFAYDVHSQNPVGAEHIRSLLDRYIRFVREENVISAGSSQERSDRGT